MDTTIVLLLIAACALVGFLFHHAFRREYLLHLRFRWDEMFFERRGRRYHPVRLLALPIAIVRYALGGWRLVRGSAGEAPPVRSGRRPRWAAGRDSRARPRYFPGTRARAHR